MERWKATGVIGLSECNLKVWALFCLHFVLWWTCVFLFAKSWLGWKVLTMFRSTMPCRVVFFLEHACGSRNHDTCESRKYIISILINLLWTTCWEHLSNDEGSCWFVFEQAIPEEVWDCISFARVLDLRNNVIQEVSPYIGCMSLLQVIMLLHFEFGYMDFFP